MTKPSVRLLLLLLLVAGAISLVASPSPSASSQGGAGNAWQPKGKLVVVKLTAYRPRSLHVARLDGSGCGEVFRLPDDTRIVDVAPGAGTVAYVVDAGVERLYVSGLNGENRRAVGTYSANGGWGWVNSRQLVYVESWPDREELVIVDTATGETARRSWQSDQDFGGPVAVSPDGQRIIFAKQWGTSRNRQNALALMRLDGVGGIRELYRSKGYRDDPPAGFWSPEGRRILIVDDGLYTINANGTKLKRLTRWKAARDFWRDPEWSPDGRKILFTKPPYESRDVYVMNADGGYIRRLTFGGASWLAHWSPDGRGFTFQRRNSVAVLGLDRTGGRTICRESRRSEGFQPLAWLR